jgi:hypothetical protein
MRVGQYVRINDGKYAGEVGYIQRETTPGSFIVFVESVDLQFIEASRKNLAAMTKRQRRAFYAHTYHPLDVTSRDEHARGRIVYGIRQRQHARHQLAA